LPSTAVGTLEFRAIQEPVRTIPNIKYYQANVKQLDFEKRIAYCSDAFKEGHRFELEYDILILATGCETNTYGVQGVAEGRAAGSVFFLKQLSDSRAIRNRLLECFERASSPGISRLEADRLLTFVVVGGGPTNIEFASELFDFLKRDVCRCLPPPPPPDP
jgi:NADH dehydrogenase/NADH:ubiquinone reductase (non-electrogenic)